ncbi:hypothetical protein CC2G_003271 [Coprinopsis cinerea AmutBmut pab1-1]|nr:hypothetical protein CC2G_003271 [Coprinopsis cinerea AmutBmut pab1-1]
MALSKSIWLCSVFHDVKNAGEGLMKEHPSSQNVQSHLRPWSQPNLTSPVADFYDYQSLIPGDCRYSLPFSPHFVCGVQTLYLDPTSPMITLVQYLSVPHTEYKRYGSSSGTAEQTTAS